MEEKKVTEKKKEDAMTREDFAVLWKTGKSSVSCPLKPSDSAPLC